MSEAAIRVEGVWKRFGHRRALVGVDVAVRPGSCFAVLGHNGAGKSTLLKILATRSQPTSGRVTVLDIDLVRRPVDARRRIGVVFHDSCLRGDLTLDENLRFYSGLHGLDGPGSDSLDLLRVLDLEGRRGDPVRTFSQGMLKRAALIRSLLHDPAVWLLDEPFSALDPAGRDLLETVIRRQRDAGKAIVVVTHDLDRGLRIADDAIVLKAGEVAARGIDGVRRFHGASSAGAD